jgi:hypothetical protein
MECGICQLECINPMIFSENPFVKNWYPEKIGMCNHSFCHDCLLPWLSNCLQFGLNFSCPICRFVYISHDRLYHAYCLSQCIKERNN